MEKTLLWSGMVIAVGSIGWGIFMAATGYPVIGVLLITNGAITGINASAYFPAQSGGPTPTPLPTHTKE